MTAALVVLLLAALVGVGALAGHSVGWDAGYRAGRRWSGWHVQLNPPAPAPVRVGAERVEHTAARPLPAAPGAVERSAR